MQAREVIFSTGKAMFSQATIKSRFFANLARFCAGGSSYSAVINHLRRSPDADVREWASWVASKAHDGAEASLAWRPDLFSVLDREIVSSGEHSGHLAEAFHYLSQFYVFVAKMEGRLYRGLLAPALLLLGGTAVLAVFQSIISGGMHSFWIHFGPPIFAMGLTIAGIFLFVRWGIREAAKNTHTDQFFRHLPIIGSAWQRLAESRFAWTLSLRIQAGTSLIPSLELAGNASRSALVQQGIRQAAAALKSRCRADNHTQTSLAEILRRQRFWSPLLLSAFSSKESLHQVAEILKVAKALQKDAILRLEQICNQAPKIAFFIVLLLLFGKIAMLFADLNMHYKGILEKL